MDCLRPAVIYYVSIGGGEFEYIGTTSRNGVNQHDSGRSQIALKCVPCKNVMFDFKETSFQGKSQREPMRNASCELNSLTSA